MFEKGTRGNTLHGILLIALFSFAAFYIAEIPFVRSHRALRFPPHPYASGGGRASSYHHRYHYRMRNHRAGRMVRTCLENG